MHGTISICEQVDSDLRTTLRRMKRDGVTATDIDELDTTDVQLLINAFEEIKSSFALSNANTAELARRAKERGEQRRFEFWTDYRT